MFFSCVCFMKEVSREDFLNWAQEISKYLLNIPTHWDGKKAILEMKNANYKHWKQMEWFGWYFQFLCEKNLKPILTIPCPKRFGRVSFDGFYKIPWDFKAHVNRPNKNDLIVNDSEATSLAITEYGAVGLILAQGDAKYNDEDGSFKRWHDNLKGGLSRYEIERIQRNAKSRLRKVEFSLKSISFIKIDDELLIKSGTFQKNFRNADGHPRRPKVLLHLDKLDKEVVYTIPFKQYQKIEDF